MSRTVPGTAWMMLLAHCACSQPARLDVADFLGPRGQQEYVYLGEQGTRIETAAVEELGANRVRIQETATIDFDGERRRSTVTYELSVEDGALISRAGDGEQILLKEPLELHGPAWTMELEHFSVAADEPTPWPLQCQITAIGRALVLAEERATVTVECVGEESSGPVDFLHGPPKFIMTRQYAESVGLIRAELAQMDESQFDATTERVLHEIRDSPQQVGLAHPVSADSDANLFEAIMAGDSDRFAELIRRGADVNAQNDVGYTPLMGAAAMNRVDLLQALVEAGANLNATTSEGGTALMVAVIQRNPEAVQFLVESGVELDHKLQAGEYGGKTALEIAREQEDREIVEILEDSGK